MTISNENLTEFITDYFTSHECEVLHHDQGVFSVQLTEAMDRTLMNRPFYWHYIKSIGLQGEPMRLKMITNPDKQNEDGEWIHFGSPRLQQIITHLKQTAQYTKLFQEIDATSQTALYPWLVMNIKLSYKGKLKKAELFSLGLNLVNGIIIANSFQ